MEIVIEGWRAGGDERKEAARVPVDQLPPLSDAQKTVAKRLGVSEEAYARSAYAGMRNQERLLAKTKRFGEVLDRMLRLKFGGARISRIRLITIENEYQIDIVDGDRTLLRVPEDMVDDFIEGGSGEVGKAIERRVEMVLKGQAA